jgi:hypothetical protein
MVVGLVAVALLLTNPAAAGFGESEAANVDVLRGLVVDFNHSYLESSALQTSQAGEGAASFATVLMHTATDLHHSIALRP